MEMKLRNQSRRRLFGLSAAFVYLGFVLAAALPGIVFCHRPEGKIAVELAGPMDPCPCQECEYCLERLARGLSRVDPDNPVLADCHCSHESAFITADRSVVRRDGFFRMPVLSGNRLPAPVYAGIAALPEMIFSGLFRPVLPPLPGRTLDLRC